MKALKRLLKRGDENGQAMIFFAVVASSLFMTMGLAVEGGNLFAQYRRMQSAADMAALVAAQDLPCSISSSCSGTPQTDACSYAKTNLQKENVGETFTCNAGTGNDIYVTIPPRSCSPYDFIDYGNNSTNARCRVGDGLGTRQSASQTYSYYVEVEITRTIHVPVLNVTFPMHVHAVARQGYPTPTDFAITLLNPTMSQEFYQFGSSNVVTIGSIMADSSSSNAIDANSGKLTESCDGGFFTAGTGSSAGLSTAQKGTYVFAPPSCGGDAVADSPAQYFPES